MVSQKKEKEALKADAWKAIEEIEGKNPHITKEKLMEELKVRNIKSKRQPSAALENPKRAPKKAETKKEPNAPKPKPKRNQNAFHLYKDATYDDIKASQPDLTYVETINVISANYKALPAAERAYWDVKAAADKTRYFTELAAYEGEAYSVSEKKVAPEKKAAPKKMAAEKAVTKTKKDAPKKKSVTKKAAAPGNLPVATKKRKANKK